MISIEVKNINLSLHENKVLENINFEIDQGDYVGIIGPNGSGKSTLIKVMLGLIKPDSGTVKFFGKSLENFEHLHDVGYVPQRIAQTDLHFPATVEEVVLSGLTARRGLFKIFKKKDLHTAHQALTTVDMFKKRKHLIGKLSGGEQQRVFIARALIGNPKILIMDEPVVGVDVGEQERLFKFLKEMNEKHGTTIIFVSHDLNVITNEAKKVLCLNRRLTCFGTPKHLMTQKHLETLYGKEMKYMHHAHHEH